MRLLVLQYNQYIEYLCVGATATMNIISGSIRSHTNSHRPHIAYESYTCYNSGLEVESSRENETEIKFKTCLFFGHFVRLICLLVYLLFLLH